MHKKWLPYNFLPHSSAFSGVNVTVWIFHLSCIFFLPNGPVNIIQGVVYFRFPPKLTNYWLAGSKINLTLSSNSYASCCLYVFNDKCHWLHYLIMWFIIIPLFDKSYIHPIVPEFMTLWSISFHFNGLLFTILAYWKIDGQNLFKILIEDGKWAIQSRISIWILKKPIVYIFSFFLNHFFQLVVSVTLYFCTT